MLNLAQEGVKTKRCVERLCCSSVTKYCCCCKSIFDDDEAELSDLHHHKSSHGKVLFVDGANTVTHLQSDISVKGAMSALSTTDEIDLMFDDSTRMPEDTSMFLMFLHFQGIRKAF